MAIRTRRTTPSRARELGLAAIAYVLFAGAGGAPQPLVAQLPTARRDSTPPASVVFQHSRHQKLACTDCHSASARRGSNTVRGPESCRGCHHKPDQALPCTACHASAIKLVRQVPVVFKVAARRGPAVSRDLSFRHEQHGRLDCARCHGAGTDRAVQVACTSCHADHHAAERDCAACHADARAGHNRAAHDGCTSCHVNAPTPAVSASRTLCLTCHEAQRDHHPGGSCAACHAVASRAAAPGAKRP